VLKSMFKKLPILKTWLWKLDNANDRIDFVNRELSSLPEGLAILDAGCGSQMFKSACSHLVYKSQDFGQYVTDEKQMINGKEKYTDEPPYLAYKYGKIDYVGNIWEIAESDKAFDAILCTEVFEHIPYPIETIQEFSRLLKKKGRLILTAPSNCLRHMDPYFFYSGFSDRWFEEILTKHGFKILHINPVGDYYSWLGVEMARTAMAHSILAKIILFPSFVYYFSKKKTTLSVNTLCMGYHVVAEKI